MFINPKKLTRVVLVNESGKVYEGWGLRVNLSLQDSETTLKILVSIDPEAAPMTKGWFRELRGHLGA